ncbi:RTA1 like protein-domain-containing protein [Dioszegia hungarica]|uniref:RTA1 like protein-domain-containing protein n=1 Tax=Dioszegia hungarica TaxID=4972 RepID=A0AA38LXA9_9TREE|nr:RTA1 like protein-domain-containing protein [Dioszegia hungarica]KAI9637186.1 RTA1 like protein-domain-containing protein [Dioszegia hungarica]
MSVDSTGRYLVTGYVPSMALSIVAGACFSVLSAIFTYFFFKSRSHRWMLSLTIGSICMSIGFFVRIAMTNDPYGLTIYIITTLLTLLSPCAFLAHAYLLLPRLATALDASDCLLLRPRLIARTFVWIDVTVFLLQAAGGGMTAISNRSITDAGLKIALIGLIAQCISFGAFCLLVAVFAWKLRKHHPQKWSGSTSSWRTNWRVVYYALIWTCVFILIRCAFRVAEYSEGYSGKLRTTEWYIYTFDTLSLFVGIAIWAIVWPPRYLDAADDKTVKGTTLGSEEMMVRNPGGHEVQQKY